jgi:hypothetical protein
MFVGSNKKVGVFLILFFFVTDYFLLSRFFVYVADLSVQIFFVTDLFIRPDIFFLFIRRAQRLCATMAASRQLPPCLLS